VDIVHAPSPSEQATESKGKQSSSQTSRLWDREIEGGFPGKVPYQLLHLNILRIWAGCEFSFAFCLRSYLSHITAIEVKKLKQLVRDIIDPTRNLGHVDGHKMEEKPSDELSGKKDAESKQPPTDDRAESTIVTDSDAGIARGPPADGRNVDSKQPSTPEKIETTIPIDPDAAVGRGPPGDEAEEKGKWGQGRDEGCEGCEGCN